MSERSVEEMDAARDEMPDYGPGCYAWRPGDSDTICSLKHGDRKSVV